MTWAGVTAALRACLSPFRTSLHTSFSSPHSWHQGPREFLVSNAGGVHPPKAGSAPSLHALEDPEVAEGSCLGEGYGSVSWCLCADEDPHDPGKPSNQEAAGHQA